jgi:hypothetical protein
MVLVNPPQPAASTRNGTMRFPFSDAGTVMPEGKPERTDSIIRADAAPLHPD